MAVVRAGAFVEIDFIAARFDAEDLVMAGPGRRLLGYLIDQLLATFPAVLLFYALIAAIFDATAGVVLLLVATTVWLGGMAWYLFTLANGQTPGKQLLGMYTMKADGTRAGGWYTLLRNLVLRDWTTIPLTFLTFGFYWTLAALWCLWDKNNQCLWDKLASTYIAWSPAGFKPLTMNELRASGLRPPTPDHRWRGSGSRGDDMAARTPLPEHGNGLARAGCIGVFDGGRAQPDVSVPAGAAIVVGREPGAQIRIHDPRASRRHLEIQLDGDAWLLRDLGAMNTAMLLDARGERPLSGSARVPYGQVAIGNAVITLYPVGRK